MTYRRIDVYVPETHVEAVRNAMFDAGAGSIGRYDRCCFETAGYGRFRPLAGSDPFLGVCGREEQVAERKIEMICPEEKIGAVIDALRRAHPYETPAFQHWRVEIG